MDTKTLKRYVINLDNYSHTVIMDNTATPSDWKAEEEEARTYNLSPEKYQVVTQQARKLFRLSNREEATDRLNYLFDGLAKRLPLRPDSTPSPPPTIKETEVWNEKCS